MTKFESPYGDWPKVTLVKDASAGPGVHITGRYLAPYQRKNILAYWGIPWMFAFLCGTFFLAAHKLMSERVFLGMILTSVAGYFVLWRPLMRLALAGQVDVKVFADAIQVGNGFSYKAYDRNVPIEIRLEQHHKALERMQPQRAEVFRQASEVVVRYGTKRIMIAELELCDLEMAKSLVLRLQEAVLKLDAAGAMASKLVAAGSTGNDFEIN